METIKFSTKSTFFKIWHALSFYTKAYNYPKDTCTLKRRTIYYGTWALLSLPVFVFIQTFCILFPKVKREISDAGTIIHGVNISVMLLGMAAFYKDYGLLGSYLFGGIALLTCFLLTALVLWGLISAYFKWDESRPKKPKVFKEKRTPMLVEIYNGWKDKLCSKIEYED